jgi:hypothetical protein
MRGVGAARNKLIQQQLSEANPKFHAGPNELEKEPELKIIQPTNAEQLKQLTGLVEALRRQNMGDQAWQNALRLWQMQITTGALSDVVKLEFVKRFYFWLLGRGTEKDVLKTFWGRGNAAVINREVALYIEQFSQRRLDYALQLSLLAGRVPTSLNGYYLYFKYIVNGKLQRTTDHNGATWWEMSSDDYLQDFELFQQEFDAYEGQSKYKDLIRPAATRDAQSKPFDASRPYPSTQDEMEKDQLERKEDSQLLAGVMQQNNLDKDPPANAMDPQVPYNANPKQPTVAPLVTAQGLAAQGAAPSATETRMLGLVQQIMREGQAQRAEAEKERQARLAAKQAKVKPQPITPEHIDARARIMIDAAADANLDKVVKRLRSELPQTVEEQDKQGMLSLLRDELKSMSDKHERLLDAISSGAQSQREFNEQLSTQLSALKEVRGIANDFAQKDEMDVSPDDVAEETQAAQVRAQTFRGDSQPDPDVENARQQAIARQHAEQLMQAQQESERLRQELADATQANRQQAQRAFEELNAQARLKADADLATLTDAMEQKMKKLVKKVRAEVVATHQGAPPEVMQELRQKLQTMETQLAQNNPQQQVAALTEELKRFMNVSSAQLAQKVAEAQRDLAVSVAQRPAHVDKGEYAELQKLRAQPVVPPTAVEVPMQRDREKLQKVQQQVTLFEERVRVAEKRELDLKETSARELTAAQDKLKDLQAKYKERKKASKDVKAQKKTLELKVIDERARHDTELAQLKQEATFAKDRAATLEESKKEAQKALADAKARPQQSEDEIVQLTTRVRKAEEAAKSAQEALSAQTAKESEFTETWKKRLAELSETHATELAQANKTIAEAKTSAQEFRQAAEAEILRLSDATKEQKKQLQTIATEKQAAEQEAVRLKKQYEQGNRELAAHHEAQLATARTETEAKVKQQLVAEAKRYKRELETAAGKQLEALKKQLTTAQPEEVKQLQAQIHAKEQEVQEVQQRLVDATVALNNQLLQEKAKVQQGKQQIDTLVRQQEAAKVKLQEAQGTVGEFSAKLAQESEKAANAQQQLTAYKETQDTLLRKLEVESAAVRQAQEELRQAVTATAIADREREVYRKKQVEAETAKEAAQNEARQAKLQYSILLAQNQALRARQTESTPEVVQGKRAREEEPVQQQQMVPVEEEPVQQQQMVPVEKEKEEASASPPVAPTMKIVTAGFEMPPLPAQIPLPEETEAEAEISEEALAEGKRARAQNLERKHIKQIKVAGESMARFKERQKQQQFDLQARSPDVQEKVYAKTKEVQTAEKDMIELLLRADSIKDRKRLAKQAVIRQAPNATPQQQKLIVERLLQQAMRQEELEV